MTPQPFLLFTPAAPGNARIIDMSSSRLSGWDAHNVWSGLKLCSHKLPSLVMHLHWTKCQVVEAVLYCV